MAIGAGSRRLCSKLWIDPDEAVPHVLRRLDGLECQIELTVGEGDCSIHSVFGHASQRGFYKENARFFLMQSMGSTVDDFRRCVNDEALQL